jgi:photosystem II stability/assembly factor-like uncharacterized protein
MKRGLLDFKCKNLFCFTTLLAIFFVLTYAPVFAGPNQWTVSSSGMNMPTLYSLTFAIALSKNNTELIYATGGYGSDPLNRSTDGGNTWNIVTSLSPYGTFAIQIDPTNYNIIYLGLSTISSSMLKSLDGGNSWSYITTGLGSGNPPYFQQYPLLIDPNNDNIIYANPTLSKSTNGGQSWSLITSGLTEAVGDIVIDPTNSQTLYACSQDNLYKSVNGGNSWTILTSITNAYFTGIAVDSQNPLQIYSAGGATKILKSQNGGATWTLSSTGLNEQINGTLLIDPSNSSTLYVCTGSWGVYRSLDQGATWNPFGNQIFATNQLVMTTSGNTTLYATGVHGVWIYTITSTGIKPSYWQQLDSKIPNNPSLAITTSRE